MTKIIQVALAAVVFAVAVWVTPNEASAANCNFNRNEKIAMVSWIIPIAGAVITPMACRRDMFNKKNKGAAIRPEDGRAGRDGVIADRRRRNAA
ncbi:MAG: hypothetical protein AAGF92_17195 [Myxococcota bacterium]